MKRFEVKRNEPKELETKSGYRTVLYPASRYSVVLGSKVVCNVPDYVANPAGVAAGICEILNRDKKFVLPI